MGDDERGLQQLRSEDEQLVLAARSGDRDAFGQLVGRWSDRCWEVAWRILHDRGLAADVAQDALMTAWQQLGRLESPGSFGGWVLRITRNRALDRLERERRTVPTDDEVTLEPAGGVQHADPVDEFERGRRRDLVWAASAALGERDASVLDLLLRHGLEPHELADALNVTPNAAHQVLFRLRRRLGAAIRAWLIWRAGQPTCVVLGAELAAAGVTEFGADLVRAVERHAATCDACDEERERVVAPAAMFSAVPLMMMPAALRTQLTAGLADAGVPVPPPAGGNGDGVDGAGDSGGDVPADATAGADEKAAAGDKAGVPWYPVLAGLAVVALVLMLGLGLWSGVGEPPVEVLGQLDAIPVLADDEQDASSAGPDTYSYGGEDVPPVLPPFDLNMTENDEGDGARGPEPSPTPPSEQPAPENPSGPGRGDPDPGTDDPDPDDPDPDDPDPDDPDDPDPDPPVIDRFVWRTTTRTCPQGSGVLHDAQWATRDGHTATMTVDNDRPQTVDLSGTQVFCAGRAATFVLTVIGDGGTATASQPGP